MLLPWIGYIPHYHILDVFYFNCYLFIFKKCLYVLLVLPEDDDDDDKDDDGDDDDDDDDDDVVQCGPRKSIGKVEKEGTKQYFMENVSSSLSSS